MLIFGKGVRNIRFFFGGVLSLSPWALAFAGTPSEVSHLDPLSPILFWVALIFSFAILGRYLAQKVGQPAVLGELLIGIVLGNVCYFSGSQLMTLLREGPVIYDLMRSLLQGEGLSKALLNSHLSLKAAGELEQVLSSVNGLDYLKVAYVLDVFSRYGVLFLLFLVGVESSFSELKRTGAASVRVAFVGVIAPLLLGYWVSAYLMPTLSYTTNLFIAATLCATSVGVTARVFRELGCLKTREAQTVLGAAMLDDILGLLLLAVVTGMAVQGSVELGSLLKELFVALLFFVLVLSVGPRLLQKIALSFRCFDDWESKLMVSFLVLMLVSWLATLVNLSAIVGAFAAGLILHDDYFKKTTHGQSKTIQDLLSPLEALLAPLFFVLIGMQVKVELFFDSELWVLSGGLLGAAVVGKLLAGRVASKKDDALLIGIGMIPRGEVGLIFASIGKSVGVLSDQIFSAVVLMVMMTTLMTPPLMKWRYQGGEMT